MSLLRIDEVTPSAGGTPTSLPGGLAKAWVNHQVDGVVNTSLNISSVTDNATGSFIPNLTSPFSTDKFVVMNSGSLGADAVHCNNYFRTASSFRLQYIHWSTGSSTDPTNLLSFGAAIGDLA